MSADLINYYMNKKISPYLARIRAKIVRYHTLHRGHQICEYFVRNLCKSTPETCIYIHPGRKYKLLCAELDGFFKAKNGKKACLDFVFDKCRLHDKCEAVHDLEYRFTLHYIITSSTYAAISDHESDQDDDFLFYYESDRTDEKAEIKLAVERQSEDRRSKKFEKKSVSSGKLLDTQHNVSTFGIQQGYSKILPLLENVIPIKDQLSSSDPLFLPKMKCKIIEFLAWHPNITFCDSFLRNRCKVNHCSKEHNNQYYNTLVNQVDRYFYHLYQSRTRQWHQFGRNINKDKLPPIIDLCYFFSFSQCTNACRFIHDDEYRQFWIDVSTIMFRSLEYTQILASFDKSAATAIPSASSAAPLSQQRANQIATQNILIPTTTSANLVKKISIHTIIHKDTTFQLLLENFITHCAENEFQLGCLLNARHCCQKLQSIPYFEENSVDHHCDYDESDSDHDSETKIAHVCVDAPQHFTRSSSLPQQFSQCQKNHNDVVFNELSALIDEYYISNYSPKQQIPCYEFIFFTDPFSSISSTDTQVLPNSTPSSFDLTSSAFKLDQTRSILTHNCAFRHDLVYKSIWAKTLESLYERIQSNRELRHQEKELQRLVLQEEKKKKNQHKYDLSQPPPSLVNMTDGDLQQHYLYDDAYITQLFEGGFLPDQFMPLEEQNYYFHLCQVEEKKKLFAPTPNPTDPIVSPGQLSQPQQHREFLYFFYLTRKYYVVIELCKKLYTKHRLLMNVAIGPS